MKPIRSRTRSRLAAVLAGALAAAGLVAMAPAAQADPTPTPGQLAWGVKSGFRTYVAGQLGSIPPIGAAPIGERITLEAPATFDPPLLTEPTAVSDINRPYLFPGTTQGATSPSAMTIQTTGGVQWDFPSHNFTVTMKNVKVVVADGQADVYADTHYVGGDNPMGIPEDDIDVEEAHIGTSTNVTATVNGSDVDLAVTGITLTEEGATVLPFYEEGAELDDLEYHTFRTEVTVSQTEVSEHGSTVVTVTGTGFLPSLATGARPPLSGKAAGTYVVFGKFAPEWKPSEGKASSTRTAASVASGGQKWAVPAESVATVGGATAGAVTLNPDGSFEAKIRISKALIDAAAPGGNTNYGIYTYPGSGGTQPLYETYTPITFSSGGTNVGLDKASYSGVAGTAVPVEVTVSDPDVTGTPTGTVTLASVPSDGTRTVIDTATLDGSGVAALEIPSNWPAGSAALVAEYAGDGDFASATSVPASYLIQADSQLTFDKAEYQTLPGTPLTVKLTVAMPSGVAAPTGNVVLTYTPTDDDPISLPAVNLKAANAGVATFEIPAQAEGTTGTLSATYAGDANYTAATATGSTFEFAKFRPVVSLDKTSYSAVEGTPIPIVVTVSGDAGVPTGEVFLAYTPPMGSLVVMDPVPLDGSGQATVTLPGNLEAGASGLQVTYTGDNVYSTRQTGVVGYEFVERYVPVVSLDKTSYSAVEGTPIPIVVTVSGDAGVPTGDVVLAYTPPMGSLVVMDPVPLDGSGQATVTLPGDLEAGSSTFQVTYLGAGPYNSGEAHASYVFLSQSTTTISGATSLPYGTTPTYTATVPEAKSGTVTVTGVGATQTVPVNASGTATFKVPGNLAVGSHTITAKFSGTAELTDSTGTLGITVTKAATQSWASVVMVKPAAAVKKANATKAALTKAKAAAKAAKTKAAKKKANQKVKRANKAAKKAAKALKKAKAVPYVKVTTAGGPTPAGWVTVTFAKGSARATASGALSGGVAMVKVPRLAKGTWSASAAYGGSGNHYGSTSSAVNVKITK